VAEFYDSGSADRRPVGLPDRSRSGSAVNEPTVVKPAVFPKPVVVNRMPAGVIQALNARFNAPSVGPAEPRSIFDSPPSPNEPGGPYGNATHVIYSDDRPPRMDVLDGPRRPVQRGVSLRNDLLRQPPQLSNEDFAPGGDYAGRSPGYAPTGDYQQQESVSGLRRNFSNQLSFSERDHVAGVNRPNQNRMRSKTPGPDFMRGVRSDTFDRESEMYAQQDAHQARRDARSKTPTLEIPRSRVALRNRMPISGTPDFIPASLYTSPGSQGGDTGSSQLLVSQPLNATGKSSASSLSSGDASQLYGGQYFDGGISVPPHRRTPAQMNIPVNSENGGQMSSTSRAAAGMGTWTTGSPASVASSRLNVDEQFFEMPVHLQRLQTGFGFRIIGGTEEGSQVMPVVCLFCTPLLKNYL
jgi:hypothetical protein